MMILSYSGGLAATFPLERAVSYTGWRTSMLGAGALCTLFVLLSIFLLKTDRRGISQGRSLANLKRIFSNKLIYPVTMHGQRQLLGVFRASSDDRKKMLEDFAGLSSAQAASFTFTMMGTAIFSFISACKIKEPCMKNYRG